MGKKRIILVSGPGGAPSVAGARPSGEWFRDSPFELKRIPPPVSGQDAARLVTDLLADDRTAAILVIRPLSVTDDGASAVESHLHRQMPGLPEAFRGIGADIEPLAPLFRGTAGMTADGRFLADVPPAGPWLEAVIAFLGRVLPHALEKAAGDGRDCGPPPEGGDGR
jgi:hypothetical protein